MTARLAHPFGWVGQASIPSPRVRAPMAQPTGATCWRNPRPNVWASQRGPCVESPSHFNSRPTPKNEEEGVITIRCGVRSTAEGIIWRRGAMSNPGAARANTGADRSRPEQTPEQTGANRGPPEHVRGAPEQAPEQTGANRGKNRSRPEQTEVHRSKPKGHRSKHLSKRVWEVQNLPCSGVWAVHVRFPPGRSLALEVQARLPLVFIPVPSSPVFMKAQPLGATCGHGATHGYGATCGASFIAQCAAQPTATFGLRFACDALGCQ